jgi:hypothetical protein
MWKNTSKHKSKSKRTEHNSKQIEQFDELINCSIFGRESLRRVESAKLFRRFHKALKIAQASKAQKKTHFEGHKKSDFRQKKSNM